MNFGWDKNVKLSDLFNNLVDRWIAVISVIITLLSIVLTNDNKYMHTIPVLIVAQGFLFCFGFRHVYIKVKYEKMAEQFQEEIKKHQATLAEREKCIEECKNNTLQILEKISLCLKNQGKLNNFMYDNLSKFDSDSYLNTYIIAKTSLSHDEKIELLKNNLRNYERSLYEAYKRYTTNMLTSVREIQESYINICGNDVTIAVSVKLLNKYYEEGGALTDLKVFTAFRDKSSYEQGKREVQTSLFTIMGNTDFSQCVKKDYFIKNNICEGECSYLNENKEFLKYYNSTVVVPIMIKQNNGKNKYFGYLCCDALNDDSSIELFDETSANILFFYAQLYAHYLETLEFNWRDRNETGCSEYDSFLDYLFRRKKVIENEE